MAMSRLLMLVFAAASWVGAAIAQMTINGVVPNSGTVTFLQSEHNIQPNGRYWYDPASGLLGPWGGPPVAQMPPNVTDFGRVPDGASGYYSGVKVNGRSVSMVEENALNHTYTMMVEGDYVMGPDLVMRKNYAGAPPFNYGQAWRAFQQSNNAEQQWCAEARRRAQASPPGQPIIMTDPGSGRMSVQITMDRNGCMIGNVQGQFFSRCCN
ncbi:MAG: hypothetical protein AAFR41_06525 [Pseudomonadota bacterium]